MAKKKMTGKRRALIASGSVLAVGALLTSALFVDNAFLGLGSSASNNTIGPGADKVFDLKVSKENTPILSDAAANYQDYDVRSSPGLVINPDLKTLVPGGAAAIVNIPIKNVSAGNIDMKIDIKILNRNADIKPGGSQAIPGLTAAQIDYYTESLECAVDVRGVQAIGWGSCNGLVGAEPANVGDPEPAGFNEIMGAGAPLQQNTAALVTMKFRLKDQGAVNNMKLTQGATKFVVHFAATGL
ncbi:hypothetical protein G7066_12660 [Leucobacter coleopterorum]|uniref:SipW-cognate class signal peptide n=1 Tax=Leucobacter coleopterorum TaxID=2714933 RepID=A0ABX6K027_9MICO|nr:hypothetical protein [Leucobacter coleopterorum]QIM19208.1 hypothetical protein G7066_12660 [Leucobacter coleopterorum]